MKLSELEWENARIESDGEFDYFGLLSYSSAPGNILSFYGNIGFKNDLKNKKISCVICKEDLLDSLPEHVVGKVISDNPLYTFWTMHEKYGNTDRFEFETQIGKNSRISNQAFVDSKGVVIGDNVVIEEFVSIKKGTRIGNDVVIKAGSVIGADCFITADKSEERFVATLLGGVKICDGVRIYNNNVITKGTFEWVDTFIGLGTLINANCSISHNAMLGRRVMMCDGVTISGDNTIGDDVWISPAVHTTNSIKIGNGASIMLGEIVRKDVSDKMVVVAGREYRRDLYSAIRKMQK